MTDDLVAFLKARLDDTAAKATAARGTTWDATPGDVAADAWVINEDMHLLETDAGTAAHIAEHDPARVLAEVTAKRQLTDASNAWCSQACLTEHSFSGSCGLRWMGPVHEDEDGRWLYDDTDARFSAPPVTSAWALRLLALPFADHPDYRPEWAPNA